MSKNKNTTAVKAGLGYTIGNILVRGIGFISLPIFSRIMSTEQFGIYNVFVSYEAILFVIVGLAMHSSIQSANIQFRGGIKEYTSSVSIIYIINLIILLIISFIFRNTLAELMDFEPFIISFLVIYSFSSALLLLYNNKISLEYQYKKYITISLINSLGNVLLSLLLILTVFTEQREYGRIVGATVSLFIVAMIVLISLYRDAKPKINMEYWNFAVKYSLPIVPHGIAQVLLGQVDRIMIRNFVGNSYAGIYSLAGNIKLILTVITDSITTAWRTWFYKAADENRIRDIQKNAVDLSGVYTIFAVGLMALSPELLWILGGQEYQEGIYVAIPMIVDAFLLFLYGVIVQSEYYAKKTSYILLGTIIAAVIDVIGNYIFIQKYGYIAAAYTTLFAYACYLILHIAISHKVVNFFVIPIKWILTYIGIVCTFGAVDLLLLEHMLLRWGICLIAVIPAGIYLLRKTGYDKLLTEKVKEREK